MFCGFHNQMPFKPLWLTATPPLSPAARPRFSARALSLNIPAYGGWQKRPGSYRANSAVDR